MEYTGSIDPYSQAICNDRKPGRMFYCFSNGMRSVQMGHRANLLWKINLT